MKGLFIQGITVEMFRSGCLESIEALMAEGEIYDIEYEPERKTGKWVNNIHDLPVCDQCGYMTPYDRAIDDYEYGNFCTNCGADMRGKQDGR